MPSGMVFTTSALLERFRKEIEGIKDKIFAINNRHKPTANPKINVKGVLYGNVHLSIGKVTEEFIEPQKMTKSIIENTVNGGLRFLNMSSLFAKASDMEKAVIMHLVREPQQAAYAAPQSPIN